jgi:hypothetical protein
VFPTDGHFITQRFDVVKPSGGGGVLKLIIRHQFCRLRALSSATLRVNELFLTNKNRLSLPLMSVIAIALAVSAV